MTYSRDKFLFTHLLQQVVSQLGQSKSLQATGGSTSTIVDTDIADDVEDDAFKNQWAFISYDAGGAGAAPEGEFARCTGYTASSKTLSFATGSFTVAPAAGDKVTLVRDSIYSILDVMRRCNEALRDLGKLPLVDSSLVAAAATTSYTLPLAIKGSQIVRVDYLDSATSVYIPVQFYVRPATTGATETLVIPQLDAGATIYITYIGDQHPWMNEFDDPVSEYIPQALAVAKCALWVAEWRPDVSQNILPKLRNDLANATLMQPVRRMVPAARGFPHWN